MLIFRDIWWFLQISLVLLLLFSSSLAQLVITGCFDTHRFRLRELMNQTSEFSLQTAPVMPSHHHHPHREIYTALKIPDVKRLFSRVTVSQHQLHEQMKQSLMTSTKPRLEAVLSLRLSAVTLEIFLFVDSFVVISEHKWRRFKRQRSAVAAYNHIKIQHGGSLKLMRLGRLCETQVAYFANSTVFNQSGSLLNWLLKLIRHLQSLLQSG